MQTTIDRFVIKSQAARSDAKQPIRVRQSPDEDSAAPVAEGVPIQATKRRIGETVVTTLDGYNHSYTDSSSSQGKLESLVSLKCLCSFH